MTKKILKIAAAIALLVFGFALGVYGISHNGTFGSTSYDQTNVTDLNVSGSFTLGGVSPVSVKSNVTNGTLLSQSQFLPTASSAVSGINRHQLVSFGDVTGTTAYGFGDPTKATYGVMASFGRTATATSAWSGTDTSLDVRMINKLNNDAAYLMQGAYIKAKNYTGGTVGTLKGLDLEYANDGTATNVIGLNIRNTGGTAGAHSDIKLSNGAVITTGSATTDTNIKADVGTLPAGSIYISSNGTGEIWIMQTTTWTKLTVN